MKLFIIIFAAVLLALTVAWKLNDSVQKARAADAKALKDAKELLVTLSKLAVLTEERFTDRDKPSSPWTAEMDRAAQSVELGADTLNKYGERIEGAWYAREGMADSWTKVAAKIRQNHPDHSKEAADIDAAVAKVRVAKAKL